LAEASGLSLDVAGVEGARISADAEWIERAVGNLVGNAIKFTPAGGGVRLRTRVADHEALIEVHDTGVGIEPADVPRIFERFYKVDTGRVKGGTGLGLSIARHAIEAYGGRIEVESVAGSGSTFTVHLPLSGTGPPQPGRT